MPPGARLLMRNLGMRAIDRESKMRTRNRPNPTVFDRPRAGHHRSFEGLSESQVDRRFEYERSQWPRQGFFSPFENDRGRAARDEQEFQLWLHWHRDQQEILALMGYEHERGIKSRFGHAVFIYDQDPYGYHRGAIRPHRFVNIRDPRWRPPYDQYERDNFYRGRGHLPPGVHGGHGGRGIPPMRNHPPLGEPFQRPWEHQDYRERVRPPIHPHGGHQQHHEQGRRPQPYPEYDRRYDRRYDGRDRFPPPAYSVYPLSQDSEEEFSTRSSSFSNGSYDRRRPSPFVVWPEVPPYYGHPLGHDNPYIDDESNDEYDLYHRRPRHRGRNRNPGERFRFERRGRYERGRGEYEFSGDDD